MMPFKFKFELYSSLLPIYKEYMQLRLKATALSRKDSERAGKKYLEAAEKRDAFARDVVAKAVYDIFSPLHPSLLNADKEMTVTWETVFDGEFDQMSNKQKYYLVGLIEGDYVYELPSEYYND